MLLNSKTAIREQIGGEAFARPAERRAKLVQMTEMIDDVIALMNEHHKHCSCESTSFAAQASSLSLGGSRRRRQPPKPLVGVSGVVRG